MSFSVLSASLRRPAADSIFAPEAVGRGVGRALLARLVADGERRGDRQMLAVIGDSASTASIAVHRACGFTPKCTLDAVGFKFGRWVDSVIMQRPLGQSHRTLPTHAGREPSPPHSISR